MYVQSDRRLFSSTILDVINNHAKVSHKLGHSLEMVGYLFFLARFTYIMACLTSPELYSPLAVDYFTHVFAQLSTDRDVCFGLTFISLFLSALALEWYIYFSPVERMSWQLPYHQGIVTQQIFAQCTVSEREKQIVIEQTVSSIEPSLKSAVPFVPSFVRRLLVNRLAQFVIWKSCAFVDFAKVECTFKWKYTPLAPMALRRKTFIILDLQERITYLTMLGICKYF